MKNKNGFTVVELLVVTGIIGVLIAVLLGAFGGASESAQKARCMSNMRGLVMAMTSIAMKDKVNGYPAAAPFTRWNPEYGEAYSAAGEAWIGLNKDGDLPSFMGDKNDENNYEALTNGYLWSAVKGGRDTYVCPAHRKYCHKKYNLTPIWSYVCNANFLHHYVAGGYVGGDEGDVSFEAPRWQLYGTMTRGVKVTENGSSSVMADRMLMFAELPITVDSIGTVDPYEGGDKFQQDCALQFKASINGSVHTPGGYDWSGKAEVIGFPHMTAKNRYCGNLAYSDGHVETIYHPGPGQSQSQLELLTALLCEACDYRYDKSGFHLDEE